jgi:hypothetical protein
MHVTTAIRMLVRRNTIFIRKSIDRRLYGATAISDANAVGKHKKKRRRMSGAGM